MGQSKAQPSHAEGWSGRITRPIMLCSPGLDAPGLDAAGLDTPGSATMTTRNFGFGANWGYLGLPGLPGGDGKFWNPGQLYWQLGLALGLPEATEAARRRPEIWVSRAIGSWATVGSGATWGYLITSHPEFQVSCFGAAGENNFDLGTWCYLITSSPEFQVLGGWVYLVIPDHEQS